MSLKLKRFDPESIDDYASVVLIGKRITGKTTLAQHLLGSFADIPRGFVVSQHSDDYGFEHQDIQCHEEYDQEALKTFLQEQKQRIRACRKREAQEDCRAFVLLDDHILQQNRANKYIHYLFTNGRNYRLLVVILLQYPCLPPKLRANTDYVFMFRDNVLSSRRKLFEHFGGMIDKFETFNTVLEHCTDDYGTLVYDNTTKSTKLNEVFSWYKVDKKEVEAQVEKEDEDDAEQAQPADGAEEEGACILM
jgi:hypothetical protein